MCKLISLQRSQILIMTELVDKQKSQLAELLAKINIIEKLQTTQMIWKIDNYMVFFEI
jgi:hypothetical protein